MEGLLISKSIFLFLAIWWTMVNTAKLHRGHSVPGINFVLQAIGITGFIVCQLLI